MESYPYPYQQKYAEMEPYLDGCQLVRDNKFKVTNMQTWSHIHIHVSNNMLFMEPYPDPCEQ